MSLSQENIDKLCMTGIYRCDPVLSWIESWRRDSPYHCINWTFKVYMYDEYNKIYMRDTYWSGGSGLSIKLTDENFDKFDLLFDMNDVHRVSPPDFYDYNEEDRWHIALDSGGYRFSKYYFVRNGAKKNKNIQLERLNRELESLKNEVKWKKEEIAKILAEDTE
jgi:hypothetical protein